MAVQKLLSLACFLVILVSANGADLQLGFYSKSCPQAEKVIQKVTEQYVSHKPSLAGALLRMNFHDCFVRGCDASVLLKPTKSNSETEMTAVPNLTLRGFEVVDAIKSKLEKECPGVVSCADILTLSARDAVRVIKGPFWEVPLGRRDGTESHASEANRDLPSPFADINTLKQAFASKGLNSMDLVLLSAGHSVGIAHCPVVRPRLYNFNGNGGVDPTISPRYASYLKNKCPQDPSDNSIVACDHITPKILDEKYYTMVMQNRGLFTSDAALLNDPELKAYMQLQVETQGSTFAKDFAKSMIKMNEIEVLTGSAGQIRKTCGFVN